MFVSKDSQAHSHFRLAAGRLFFQVVLCCCCALLTVQPVAAQGDLSVMASDTSSPRDTLRSFINACNAVYKIIETEKYLNPESPEHRAIAYRVLDCLDISELPAYAREEQAAEIAVCIKEILDRVQLPEWDEIPDIEEIQAAGGYEMLSRWRIPDTRITIARIEEGAQKHEYLFSAGTANRAVSYYESVKSQPYRQTGPEISAGFYEWYMSSPRNPYLAEFVDGLPDWLKHGRSMGLARWKWPLLILATAVAVVSMTLLYWLYLRITASMERTRLFRYWLTLTLPILAVCVPLLFMNVVHRKIGIFGTPLYVLDYISIFVSIGAGVVLIFATVTRIAETVIASPRISPFGLNAQLIRVLAKLVAFAGVTALILYGGQYLGIPVGTLLASAGIGGLALALGSQDTLKDLFGTVSLMADKPFRVGERIILGKYDGVVEDIGLRSTKLRLLNGHLVTLPNDQLARSQIENVGRRPYIRRIADIQLPLDTPRSSIEQAIASIRSVLGEHEGMDPEYPPRVYFTDYLPTAFNIKVIYWYYPPNYWDYLAMSEKVNLAIFRAFEEQGIQFSLPSRVAHTSVDSVEKPVEVRMLDSNRD